MSTTYNQTEQALERATTREVRERGAERLHTVQDARDNLFIHYKKPAQSEKPVAAPTPAATISASKEVAAVESNPPVTVHHTTAAEAMTSKVEVQAQNPASTDETAEARHLQSIRDQVADLASESNAAKDDYGLVA